MIRIGSPIHSVSIIVPTSAPVSPKSVTTLQCRTSIAQRYSSLSFKGTVSTMGYLQDASTTGHSHTGSTIYSSLVTCWFLMVIIADQVEKPLTVNLPSTAALEVVNETGCPKVTRTSGRGIVHLSNRRKEIVFPLLAAYDSAGQGHRQVSNPILLIG